MRWLKLIFKAITYCFYTVLVIISVTSLILGLGVFTHHGNTLIFSALEEFEPRLTISLTQGTIVDSPEYQVIRWSDGDMLLEFTQLHYQFDWQCLFKSVCLDSLSLEGAKINIPENNASERDQPKNSEPFVLQLPIPVSIKNLNLNQVNVTVAGVVIDLQSLLLNANAEENDIALHSEISGLTVILADKTENETKPQSSEKVAEPLAGIPAILNDKSLPEVKLPFNLTLNKLLLNNFKLIQNKQTLLKINSAETQLSYFGSQLKIDDLLLNIPEASLKVAGEIDLKERYPMDIKAEIKVNEIEQLQPKNLLAGQQINLHSFGDLSKLSSLITFSDLINLQLENKINLYQDNLPYSLALSWDELRWPLTGEAIVEATKGNIQSHGDLADYKAYLQSNYKILQAPPGKVSLNGHGDLQSLQLSQLVIDTLQGQVLLSGLLNWRENIDWSGQLSIKQLQPILLNESYPKNINADIKHHVVVNDQSSKQGSWQFSIPELKIDGELLDYPFALNGIIQGDQKNGLNIRKLHLNNQNNHIHINGHVAEQNDLDINIDIQDLAKLHADSSGKVKGQISLTGPVEKPALKSNIIVNQLSYFNYSIEQLNLTGKGLLSKLPVIDLKLTSQKLIANNQHIDELNITISPQSIAANKNTHEVSLSLDSELVRSDLTATFTQQLESWFAKLNKGAISTIQGTWDLDRSFKANLDKQQQFHLSPHCWVSTKSDICINQFSAGNSGDINISIRKFMLSSLQPFIPQNLTMQGGLDADLKMLWRNKQKPNIDFLLNGKNVALDIKLDEKHKQSNYYPIENLQISLNSTPKKTDFTIDLASNDLINTSITGRLTPYKEKPSIQAKLELSLPNFDAFSGLLPQLDKLQGELQSTIEIHGDIKQPNVVGKLYVVDTALSGSGIPIQINELNTTISFDQYNANIDGYFFTNDENKEVTKEGNRFTNSIKLIKDTAINTVNIPQRIAQNTLDKQQKSSKGRADINGTLSWKDSFSGNINFQAEQMLVRDYGKIELFVSPHIDLMFNDTLNVEGEVKIDEGNITVKELPEGAVNVSKDVIIVDVERKKDSTDLPMSIDIKVNLGDNLRVKAIGLDSYINGQLLVKKALKKELTINGELAFSDGSYRAFAQQLVLQDSRIIFRGTPDEPYLYIEAIRDPRTVEDGVTAGVRVTGTPDELTLTVFSDPSMSQQNALSYIMRGHSLEDSSSDNSQLAALLIDMSSSQTSDVMNNIGSKIGIDDLSLASTGHGDEQSVGVKGTIAPGVELSYGVGVFDSFTILAIRYELFKRFYIEGSSGLYQAVDAYYEWDWD